MAILPQPTVDYTDRDFEAIRRRLVGLVRSVFPDWTDFNTPSFGTILLELYAFVGDSIHFYQDAQARESFWPTVTQRLSAIRLGRLINYRMQSASPATATVRFSLPSAATVRVPIPEGTRVRTADPNAPIRFRVLTAVAIEIPSTFVDASVEQATLIDGEDFETSGSANLEIKVAQFPFIDGSAVVVAADGTYLEVDSFLDLDPLTGGLIGPESRVFRTITDQDDRVRIRFGNGAVGKIPQGIISVDYKIGGGVSGNVEAGKITVLDDQILDEAGTPASVRVTNSLAASGGVDRQTVAQARSAAPASLRVLSRSVTRDDFEVASLAVPGVARAVIVTSNEDTAIEENSGLVLVVAKGTRLASGRIAPASPSAAMISAVETRVTTTLPQTLTFVVDVQAAPFRDINVSTRVYLEAGASATEVGTAIREALHDFFAAQLSDGLANPDIDFGANILAADGSVISEVAWSDVFNAIRDVDGVRKVDEGAAGLLLNLRRLSVTVGPREFPRLGTMTVVDAATGAGL